MKSPTAAQLATLAPAVEQAREFADRSKADSTRRVYAIHWVAFTAWCSSFGLPSLPTTAQVLATYLGHRASRRPVSVSTINQVVAAIAHYHARARAYCPNTEPEVREVLSGIRRALRTAKKKAPAALPDDLRWMILALPAKGLEFRLLDVRDRALVLVGLGAALRRSELVALQFTDVAFTERGLELSIAKSKTDQEGAGQKIGVVFGRDRLTCPVRALQDWLGLSGVSDGALFRSSTGEPLDGRDVSRILKRLEKRAKLSSNFSGHSLRAGFVTAAVKRGKSTHSIMKQTRHRRADMVEEYTRDLGLFDDNASEDIGL